MPDNEAWRTIACVPLRSGGSLVIDQGEALTAIDVNTGSFTNTGSGNLEDTVTANNLEACAEVARQLRLRNIGGIIVIDFVDMDKEGNRRKVWDAFQKALSKDRARCNVTKISELGLVEMTRKRTRESLSQFLTEPCPLCEGAAVVKSTTTVAYEILREVRRSGATVDNTKIDIECAPKVAEILSTYLWGDAPVVRSTLAPVADFDQDGTPDVSDPAPYDPDR